MNRRLFVALILVSVAGCTAASSAETASSWEWEEVPRVVAIGDVHGAHDKLVRLLRALGLVDETLTWSGGETHVVFCGDLIDRGPADRAVVDLVRHLQAEAPAAGGRVHALLGNHEVMNLIGDLRYVTPEALAEFAAGETEKERRVGWERFQSEHKRHEPGIQASFEEQCPRGYFARERAFGPDGEYGAWLLEQPTVVKVNGVVFVHGGLTEEVAALGLAGINRGVREGLLKWLKRRRPTEMFDALPFAPWGPLWYRGYSLENERIVRDSLSKVLEGLGARALVVAHTPTKSERVTARFNGRLYRTDIGMGYGADPEALVLEGEEAWVFDPDTFARSRPLLEPPQGEGWSPVREELPDEQLEQFLARAKVVASREIVWGEQHVRLVELRRKGLHLHSIFQSVEEQPAKDIPPESFNPRRYQHEVAAYRLDRMLDLGMVPVAVLRKVDRQPGAVSYWLSSAIDLPYIREHGRRDLIEALESQIAKARIFTALVGTRDRDDAAKMLIPPERRIMIADNSKGFPLSTEIEDLLVLELEGFHFEACDMGATLELAMRELDRESLQAEVGDYISAAQIDALLVRRDRILEACSPSRERRLQQVKEPGVG